MPYTSNGTETCVTANSIAETLSVDTRIYAASTITDIETVIGATPLPSVRDFPTQSVYDIDEQDPKGLTYCYAFGDGRMFGYYFDRIFTDDLFGHIYHNCSNDVSQYSPVIYAEEASFLLDETTSYVDNPKTENSDVLRSRTTELSQTQTDVQVDPFQPTSASVNTQKPSSMDDTSSISSTATALTKSELLETASHSKTNQPGDDLRPIQTTGPTLNSESPSTRTQASTATTQEDGDHDSATSQESARRSTSTADGQSSSTNAQDLAKNPDTQLNSEPSLATQTVASPSSVRLDALNSLIHDLGQLQSSNGKGAEETAVDVSMQSKSSAIVDITTSLQPTPITVEPTTITANSDGDYMIGTHLLQSTASPYEHEGTTYSLDNSENALVINGKSTYALQTSQPVNDIPQAATLTLNDLTVTQNSASDYIIETQTLKPGGQAITVSGTRISLASDAAAIVVGAETSALSTTQGVGDYVWAGIAGVLSSTSVGASPTYSSSEQSMSESFKPLTTPNASPSSGVTRAAGDGETVVDSSASDFSATTDLSSPSASVADHISIQQSSTQQTSTQHTSIQQTSTSSTNPGTNSQPGPSASSSSSSSSSSIDETSSENDSGRVIVSATFAICILSLVFTIFA